MASKKTPPTPAAPAPLATPTPACPWPLKNLFFSAALALVVVLIAIRITPVRVEPVLKLVISKNRSDISQLHQARDIEATTEVFVDRLELLEKSRFKHPKLGFISPYTENFFVDIRHTIKVKQAGTYRFIAGSDDGFSLRIDGRLLCQHATDRPYSQQTCTTPLSQGEHLVEISHFQGFGNSGFTLEYALGDGRTYWFGDSSSNIAF